MRFILYPCHYRYCISSLRCEDIAGVLVMSSSSSVECGTVEHKGIIGMAVVGLAFYTIGYIVFTSVVLFNLYARKKFSDTQSLHRYGFIYERFELGYSWTAVMSTHTLPCSQTAHLSQFWHFVTAKSVVL